MARGQFAQLVGYLRHLTQSSAGAEATDAQLLRRFTAPAGQAPGGVGVTVQFRYTDHRAKRLALARWGPWGHAAR
jgi:hypothetical protein